jgi:hypothetical protein
MNIIEFLNARIDEDETIAADAKDHHWSSDDEHGLLDGSTPAWCVSSHDGAMQYITDVAYPADQEDADTSDHIARHDPARVLAECASKRAIIARFVFWQAGGPCPWKQVGDPDYVRHVPHADELEAVLHLLTLPYAGHPDYDPAWTPV